MKIYYSAMLSLTCIICFYCSCSNTSGDNAETEIYFQKTIERRADLKIDTADFVVSFDSISAEEGFLAQDYSIYTMVKFDLETFDNLIQTIRSTKNFNLVDRFQQPIWEEIDTTGSEGIWSSKDGQYIFHEKPLPRGKFERDIMHLRVDSATTSMSLTIDHI